MSSLGEPRFVQLNPDDPLRRFAVWHPPRGEHATGLVVHAHALAEEMNKSRRMVARQARLLADAGYGVLRLDLSGCGDSEGDFAQATWEQWIEDVVAACRQTVSQWQAQHAGQGPAACWLWGHRAGALLAAQAASRLGGPWNLLLWQPITNGKAALQQLLRLETAAALLGKAATMSSQPSARERLARGEVVEVGGYELNPGLAEGLEKARLLPPPVAGRLEWLEVSRGSAEDLPPVARQSLEHFTQAGWESRHHTVAGPAFWQTTEVEDAPALLELTVRALQTADESGNASPVHEAHAPTS